MKPSPLIQHQYPLRVQGGAASARPTFRGLQVKREGNAVRGEARRVSENKRSDHREEQGFSGAIRRPQGLALRARIPNGILLLHLKDLCCSNMTRSLAASALSISRRNRLTSEVASTLSCRVCLDSCTSTSHMDSNQPISRLGLLNGIGLSSRTMSLTVFLVQLSL